MRMQVFYNFIFLLTNFGYFSVLQTSNVVDSYSLEKGKQLFSIHCISCHADQKNPLVPEKNLQKETLEALGIDNRTSLFYQIINGKNGMPAFGGRLQEIEIEQIISYIFQE